MVVDSNSDFDISNPGTLCPVFAHSGISSCQSSVSDIEFFFFILDEPLQISQCHSIFANQPMTSSRRFQTLFIHVGSKEGFQKSGD